MPDSRQGLVGACRGSPHRVPRRVPCEHRLGPGMRIGARRAPYKERPIRRRSPPTATLIVTGSRVLCIHQPPRVACHLPGNPESRASENSTRSSGAGAPGGVASGPESRRVMSATRPVQSQVAQQVAEDSASGLRILSGRRTTPVRRGTVARSARGSRLGIAGRIGILGTRKVGVRQPERRTVIAASDRPVVGIVLRRTGGRILRGLSGWRRQLGCVVRRGGRSNLSPRPVPWS